MVHTSPTVDLIWTILAVTMQTYLIVHLYHFDRFKCIRIWEGNSGAFKKVMTFSYLLAVPLILVRSLIIAIIKYQVGYSFVPGFGIIPTPWPLWSEAMQKWIFPAQLCFAIAWGFEIVSHLEELCFWLFLTRTTPLHMSWYGSANFWVWIIGSALGLTAMPVVATLTRSNPLKSEAWICFVGGICSTLITVAFFYVLWIFPKFMQRVKTEGAGQSVVTRLVTFHQINIIRVGFRLLFTLPLLTLGIDGIRAQNPINESRFWVDLLAVSGAIGCMVSSILTLLIFFPRSMNREAGYDSGFRSGSRYASKEDKSFFNSPAVETANPFASIPEPSDNSAIYSGTGKIPTIEYKNNLWELEAGTAPKLPEAIPIQFKYPPRKEPRKQKRSSAIHPLIMNFRSPIDVFEDTDRLIKYRTGNYI